VAYLPETLRDRQRGLCKWSIFLCGSSVRGTWMEDSFTGDPEGCVKEGSGNGSPSLHRGPVLGDIGGNSALMGTLRER